MLLPLTRTPTQREWITDNAAPELCAREADVWVPAAPATNPPGACWQPKPDEAMRAAVIFQRSGRDSSKMIAVLQGLIRRAQSQGDAAKLRWCMEKTLADPNLFAWGVDGILQAVRVLPPQHRSELVLTFLDCLQTAEQLETFTHFAHNLARKLNDPAFTAALQNATQQRWTQLGATCANPFVPSEPATLTKADPLLGFFQGLANWQSLQGDLQQACQAVQDQVQQATGHVEIGSLFNALNTEPQTARRFAIYEKMVDATQRSQVLGYMPRLLAALELESDNTAVVKVCTSMVFHHPGKPENWMPFAMMALRHLNCADGRRPCLQRIRFLDYLDLALQDTPPVPDALTEGLLALLLRARSPEPKLLKLLTQLGVFDAYASTLPWQRAVSTAGPRSLGSLAGAPQ